MSTANDASAGSAGRCTMRHYPKASAPARLQGIEPTLSRSSSRDLRWLLVVAGLSAGTFVLGFVLGSWRALS